MVFMFPVGTNELIKISYFKVLNLERLMVEEFWWTQVDNQEVIIRVFGKVFYSSPAITSSLLSLSLSFQLHLDVNVGVVI